MGRLTDLPILAKDTLKIAPGGGNGKCPAAGEEMKQRFFLYRIVIDGTKFVVIKRVQNAVDIPADMAAPCIAGPDNAAPMTESASDVLSFLFFPQYRFFERHVGLFSLLDIFLSSFDKCYSKKLSQNKLFSFL
jgi:hypothetical protein